jgi:energy-coupling factor transport system permease protein
VAWVCWLLAVVIPLTLTRNPLYLGLILLWLAVVTITVTLGMRAELVPVMLSPLRFGLVVVPVAMIFNALNVHIGDSVLFQLPRGLPLIGGPITLEALLYGALNGLVLTGLFTAFGLINRVLTVRDLLGLIPRAYYPLAVVAAIAITFAPVTLRQFQQIREAQAIRGLRLRSLRDWLPLFLPLLLSGLERALQLAEAMTARGFAGAAAHQIERRTQWLLLLGLLCTGGGLLLRLSGQARQPGLLLLWIGAGLLLCALWLAGRHQRRSRYRPAPFRPADWLVSLAALASALIFLLPLPSVDRASLFYYPYPTLTVPAFHLLLGMATWGVLPPAAVLLLTRK